MVGRRTRHQPWYCCRIRYVGQSPLMRGLREIVTTPLRDGRQDQPLPSMITTELAEIGGVSGSQTRFPTGEACRRFKIVANPFSARVRPTESRFASRTSRKRQANRRWDRKYRDCRYAARQRDWLSPAIG